MPYRQWHLEDDPNLKYGLLARFDHDLIELAKRYRIFELPSVLLHEDSENKVIIFRKANLIFAFNFHPNQSYCQLSI